MSISDSCLNPDRRFLVEHIGFDKHIVRAKGHYLYDDKGIRYLDFVSQFGAVPFGHNPDTLWDVMRDVQEAEEPGLVQPLISPAAELLAKELVALAPGGMRYVTFTNSGAESVEVAIKLARAKTQRPVILATNTGFHGKTMGAASATGNEVYRTPFRVDTQAFDHVPFGDLEALKHRVAKGDVAAFIVEPVQGEGGMITPPEGYLVEAQEICRNHKTLLVLDEIQTGLGRTGFLFAAERDGIRPDMILLAKALGGGLLPLGACLCTARVWTEDFGLYHSSTFANNHLTCRVGLETLRMLQKDDAAIVRHVRDVSDYFESQLNALVAHYPDVFESRNGRGLMQGLQLSPWDSEGSALSLASSIGQAVPLLSGYLLNEHQLLTLPTISRNNVLRLEPPLTIQQTEIDYALDALTTAAELLHRRDFGRLLAYTAGKTAASVGPSSPTLQAARGGTSYRLPDPNERCLGRFAFLIHPTEMADVLRCMPLSIRQYEASTKKDFMGWLDSWCTRRSEPGIAYFAPAIRSSAGGYVEGWLISSLLTPERMLKLSVLQRERIMREYLDIARKLEVDMVGLGAFTSVITRGGEDVLNSKLNITTGNSLTAMAAVESLRRVTRQRGVDLGAVNTAVIGAAGSVGRLVCKKLIGVCRNITLFGNPRNPRSLDALRVQGGELYQQVFANWPKHSSSGIGAAIAEFITDPGALPERLVTQADEKSQLALFMLMEEICPTDSPVRVSVDLTEQLPTMRAVVSATSQGHSFINPSLLGQGAVVCDAARPPDVCASITNDRDDVFVYEGGLMRLPDHVRFGENNILGFETGVNLACLSETIALTMAGVRRNYSIGRNIPLEEAEAVYRIAENHGFSVHLGTNASRKMGYTVAPLPIHQGHSNDLASHGIDPAA